MGVSKLRVIQEYKKLSKELQEQVKLSYPEGFSDYLIYYTNQKGQKVSALPFETDEKVYLLKMSAEMAVKILDDDSDYDEDHNLKSEVKEIYQDRHSDADYLPFNEGDDDD